MVHDAGARVAQRAPHQSQAGDRDRGRDDPREQQQTDVGPEPHEHGRGDVRGGEHSVGDPIGHRTGARGLGSRGAVRAERPHEQAHAVQGERRGEQNRVGAHDLGGEDDERDGSGSEARRGQPRPGAP
ncbi:hypothetical protein, partial [Microbacterium lacticum]|uniref:hypothetical protein n=1 Tax=Microbacterium lacticum TaxID=33885 RepID=UPI0019D575A2